MTLLYFGIANIVITLIIYFSLSNNGEGRYAKAYRSWKYAVLIVFNLAICLSWTQRFEFKQLYGSSLLNSALISLCIICYILFDIQAHSKYSPSTKSEDLLDDDHD